MVGKLFFLLLDGGNEEYVYPDRLIQAFLVIDTTNSDPFEIPKPHTHLRLVIFTPTLSKLMALRVRIRAKGLKSV